MQLCAPADPPRNGDEDELEGADEDDNDDTGADAKEVACEGWSKLEGGLVRVAPGADVVAP
jgi:hypothetical protein